MGILPFCNATAAERFCQSPKRTQTKRRTRYQGSRERCRRGYVFASGSVCSRRRFLSYVFSSAGVLLGQKAANAGATTTTKVPSLKDFLTEQMRGLHQFQLPNGARFVVLERSNTPTVSFISFVDAGAVDEPDGKTGMAHFLEHLAFKGSRQIGTNNWAAESRLLCDLDRLYDKWHADPEAVHEQIMTLSREAEAFVDENAFGRLVQRNGGIGLNAATEADTTQYFYNLPANRTELWFALESERFRDPVFREFERERRVILEERLLRVDNDDVGKFLEEFLEVAFEKHPYRRPVIGYKEDIQRLVPADVRSFFREFYVPTRLTFVIVGDVKHQVIHDLAVRYFADLPGTGASRRQIPRYPREYSPQSPKHFQIDLASNPMCLVAYHVPPFQDPDTAALRVLSDMLDGGRLSRLYKLFIETGKASSANFSLGFPGDKYVNLGIFSALPIPGQDMQRIVDEWHTAAAHLQNPANITDKELERVRKRVRVSLLNAIMNNNEMAGLLGKFALMKGDARELFRFLDRLEAVRREDVSRVASLYLKPEHSITGFMV
jgi:predicted Zn-dependent peptidase